ncbi:uncharacterized protein LOC126373296 [Pectinophora gossypiella]|uniref:uncharacterized protein LOC126373296 n=1 Tax=Pectinophora gossypiella TaxID=13191 RepID=UPI00214DF69E|nr:uncharacterized protein LOC126373296 [Pectinophora gossypiella]
MEACGAAPASAAAPPAAKPAPPEPRGAPAPPHLASQAAPFTRALATPHRGPGPPGAGPRHPGPTGAGPRPPGPPAASPRRPGPPGASPRPAGEGSPARQSRRRPIRNQDANDDPGSYACKAQVSGFPPYTQVIDLIRLFSRFGTVRVDKLNNGASFALLTFANEHEARAAIQASKKVNIYGEFLHVKPFNYHMANRLTPRPRDFTRSKQKGTIVEPSEIDLSGDFHMQLERLLAVVRLTQDEASSLAQLYTDVEDCLRAQWPGCTAMPFGSITTGLGIKSSDADCYVHVGARAGRGRAASPGAGRVQLARRLLAARPHVFAEILPIPRANTPIVKFFHLPTQTNCDLSFKTPLGAQNSKLIAFMLHSDPRLLPMAVTIKYWAKVHDLSGTGKLTNYALTMMIIFYLQQPPLALLPAVSWLQRDPNDAIIVDNWNTGFMDNRDLLPPTQCSATLPELIGGFFEFYSMFNFDDMVVCPFIGTPIKKDLFKDLRLLPKEFDRYKNNIINSYVLPMRFTTPICVQDPFEQSHNVASAITSRLAVEIKTYFKFAANAYEKEKPNDYKDFLKTILLQKPKIVRSKAHPEYRINLFPRIILNIATPDWKAVVRDVAFAIFETMLKVKLGKVEEKVNPDSKKEKEKYMGTITKAIWRRKQFSRLYGLMTLDFQDKQTKITEEIMNVDKQMFNLQFQVIVTYAHDPKSAVVSVKLTNGDTEAFKEFGKFFISVVQNWFMVMIRPFTRQTGPDTAAKIAETIKMLDSNLENNDLDSDDDDDANENVIESADGPDSASDEGEASAEAGAAGGAAGAAAAALDAHSP